MREKLIQLLAAVHPVSQEACIQLHDYIQSVRCENCRYWTDCGWPGKEKDTHYCAQLSSGTAFDAGLTRNVGEYCEEATLLTKPDFFCAYFEVRS